MDITTLGIDLAKNTFQVYGVDKRGRCVFSRALTRAKFQNFLSHLPPCLIETRSWVVHTIGHES